MSSIKIVKYDNFYYIKSKDARNYGLTPTSIEKDLFCFNEEDIKTVINLLFTNEVSFSFEKSIIY